MRDGLLAHGQANHGRDRVDRSELRSLAGALLGNVLVDVLRRKVALVHGGTASLDTSPLNQVADGEVVVGVGDFLKVQAEVEVRWDLYVEIRTRYTYLVLILT